MLLVSQSHSTDTAQRASDTRVSGAAAHEADACAVSSARHKRPRTEKPARTYSSAEGASDSSKQDLSKREGSIQEETSLLLKGKRVEKMARPCPRTP